MKRRETIHIFILLILAGIFGFILLNNISKNRSQPGAAENRPLSSIKRPGEKYPEIKFDFSSPAATVLIEHDIESSHPNPLAPTALDGMTLEQIAWFRLNKVEKYQQLAFYHPRYHPLKYYHLQIYQSITPGEAWLGPTPYYIANPYLLVVLTCANHVTPLNLYCPDINIIYEQGVIKETRKGESARCWFDYIYKSNNNPGMIWPVTVNAWDAGFFFIYVDMDKCINVFSDQNPDHISNKVCNISYFYHVGKYKKNNISPNAVQAWLKLKQRDVPTEIYMKLWRDYPSSPKDRSDLIYIFDIDPES